MSANQIAKLCGVSQATIWYWIKKFNILARSRGEGLHIRRANHCDLSKRAIEWINGELLGDGSLCSHSPYSAKFAYASKYHEYAKYISDTLKSFGIEQAGKIIKQYHSERDYFSYHYYSLRYVELLSICKHWYPEGKKIVPKDIKLTPITLRQLFIGDGSLINQKDRRRFIRLSTNGFTISDVEWLVKQLNELGFRAVRQPSKNVIRIPSYSTKDFLNYIGNCPVSCYQYKWNLKNRRR